MANFSELQHIAQMGTPTALPKANATALGTALPTGLVYVNDLQPGLTRVSAASGFRYRQASGKWLTDAVAIQRIERLAIPPAYADVWICPLDNGHLQATGRDARGRKQYRYHTDWHRQRDETKFVRMAAFGEALPRIRARVARDLAPAKGLLLSRNRLLATLVRLLDTTFVRIGNDEYARTNGSFGLTTLRNQHAGVRGNVLQLRFRGKSGVEYAVRLDDPKVAGVVRRCQQLPGQELFQYLGEDGQPHTLSSGDVNEYLAQIGSRPKDRASGGVRFTAKDFRTWHGSVQALELTRLACSQAQEDSQARYSVKGMLAEVAKMLGNTPAVCRKSYVHPAVMALNSQLVNDPDHQQSLWKKLALSQRPDKLYAAESRLLAFLKVWQRAAKSEPARPLQRARQANLG